ncbi:hypothetical protein VPH35_021089 [Triticum aestivum]
MRSASPLLYAASGETSVRGRVVLSGRTDAVSASSSSVAERERGPVDAIFLGADFAQSASCLVVSLGEPAACGVVHGVGGVQGRGLTRIVFVRPMEGVLRSTMKGGGAGGEESRARAATPTSAPVRC